MLVVQQALWLKLLYGCDHLILIALTETVVKGQTDELFASLFAYGTSPVPASHALAHGGKMERHVMKYAKDAARF